MRRAIVILTLVLVSSLFLAAPVAAQQGPPDEAAAPDSVRRAAAAQFRADHGGAWQVRWHADAKAPATLMGGKARGYGGPAAEAGRAFLRDHKKLFGIQNARRGLEVARQNASSGSARVLYQQVHQGVPVLNSGYLVAVDEAGEVYYVSGDYYPDLEVPTTSPSLSTQAVVRQMRSDLGSGTDFEVLQKPKLSIYVKEERVDSTLSYHLVYEAEAKQREPLKAFRYVIDARSGDVLDKTSLVMHAGDHGPARTRGAVASDGGTTSGGGSAMVDGSGEVYTTNPEVQSSPTTVTLNRMRDLSPRRLDGDNVVVQDKYGDDATSSSGEFDYSTSNHYFDQVMVYYHSDEFEEWLTGLGLGANRVGKVTAETRSTDTYAGTLPSQRLAFYSDGSNHSEENPTREGSVIAHEQMHIVSETYDDLEQQDAMDEAYSDFFAIAYRHDRQGGQSTLVGHYAFRTVATHRDVDNNFDDRNNDNDNDGEPSFYDDSLVLSGALWDFKQSIKSAAQAAEFTLESLQYLDADPSFMDARNALITAVDGQVSECTIKGVFADHGIGYSCLRDFTLSGPTEVQPNSNATYEVSFSGGVPPHTIRWYDEPEAPIDEPPEQPSGDPTIYNKITGGPDDDFYIQATIEDASGAMEESSVLFVDVVSDGGDGDPGDCPPGEICVGSMEGTLAAAELLPEKFALEKSHPNPVRAGQPVTIPFALPAAADVTLSVYDVLGRRVRRIESGTVGAGHPRATIGTEGLASGVYVYRLRAVGASGEPFTGTGKLVVVK